MPWASWPKGGRPLGFFQSANQVGIAEFYQKNGFLVLENALSINEVDEINRETTKVCRNQEGKIEGATVFPSEMSDEEVLRQVLCIHFPNKTSEMMQRLLSQPAVVTALTQIIGPDVKCMQSMLFVKASGKPGQAWHQDEDYIPTRDRSLCGVWIALDDATVENGCLWVIPESQKPGVLWKQEWHEDNRFDCSLESQNFPYTDEDSFPVEVKKGSAVFFNGYLLHRSLPNRAKSGYRRALVNHYMSASSLLPWRQPEAGVSMAWADYRDIVMVAGKDPYAYMGTKNLVGAFVRAQGLGGCVNWDTKEKYNYSKGD